MKNKKFNKKLVLNRKTVAHLNNVSMDGIKGKAGGDTNYMTCGKCDSVESCAADPNCQAMD